MIATTEILGGRLAAEALKLLVRRDAFLDNPDDAETNHKFRVSIRTLRSLVAFLSPWLKASQSRRLQKDLKTVVRETSRLRELDVLAALAAELDPPAPALSAFCEQEARAERARVVKAVAGAAAREKVERSAHELLNPDWVAGIATCGLDPAFARNRFDELADSLQADLATLDPGDYERVHSVRKRAKQIRYVAERFGPVIGDDTLAIAKHMKRQQDHLGALCDAKVNREIVASWLVRPDFDSALAAEAARLA